MDIMLFSNGKLPGNTQILEFGMNWIESMVKRTGAKNFVFIPYAMIRGDYQERTDQLQAGFGKFGCNIINIDRAADPVKALQAADGVLVSGGNTWVLNKMLHDKGLVGPLRQAVLQQDKPYIGWSAGTNIAAPTMCTTNDMPIVSAAILTSLNFVPFQINPHYIEASVEGHMGETRDERIEEYLLVNPNQVVAGIPEGTLLHIKDGQLTYHAANNKPMKLFAYKQEPQYFESGSDIQFLMAMGC
ncbi:dipeptidase PepE [Vibrio sp. S17_S38]|uniref:dipeptidase PepE n=1 Tax=Vibrio sp. S17_S38 TaxID=2720229 RepID=UPI0016811112|nr:dipeptidase PepE [Vibrio sp. S17_S38]MBD1573953.1 dipeptidase PepE [Vibrio sp. S17_S38]